MNDQAGGTSRLKDLVEDGAALIGAGSITYGAHLIYEPSAFIVGGLFLLVGAWLAARKG